MQDYHNLFIYERGVIFIKLIYKLTKLFPKEEMYGLTSQLRRAAVSVVANIVEGRGKNSDKDFARFLYISRGSLNECQLYIELAKELEFINQEQFDFINNKINEMGFLLYKFIGSLE